MLSTPPSAALMKYGCLPSGIVFHSKYPDAGTMQRLR
jgi:hypothetical protein